MEFIEKAGIRLEHWIFHNEQHEAEYEAFARELEENGKAESAAQIREMTEFSRKGTECLKKALEELAAGK